MSDIIFKELKKERIKGYWKFEKLSKNNLDAMSWSSDLEPWIELCEVTNKKKKKKFFFFFACVLISSKERRHIIQGLGNQDNTNDSIWWQWWRREFFRPGFFI